MTVRQIVLGCFRWGSPPPKMVQDYSVYRVVKVGQEHMGNDLRITHRIDLAMIPVGVTIKQFSLRTAEGERPWALMLAFDYEHEHGPCQRVHHDKANGVTIVFTLRKRHHWLERRIAEVKIDLEEMYEETVNDRLMLAIDQFAKIDGNLCFVHQPVKKAICLALEQR